MPKKEMETWLSKTTTRVGTSVGSAKHFSLSLLYGFSSKS